MFRESLANIVPEHELLEFNGSHLNKLSKLSDDVLPIPELILDLMPLLL